MHTLGSRLLFLYACASAACLGQVTVRVGDPAADALVRPLLGVNAGPTPAGEPGNAELTSQYREVGVNMVRTHDFYGPLDMPTLYPNQEADPEAQSSYNFASSDAIYRAILDGGFEPYLRIGDSYNNVRRVTHPENWTRAAVEVVRHYQDPGLWGRVPLRYVEIYNEPDNAHFWKGTREEFFRLFAQTAKALKQAFPHLKIGGPGFAPTGFLTPQGRAMAAGLLEYCRAQGAPLDFLSFHVYSNQPSDYADAAAYYRGILAANNYASAELHITEWNTEEPERGDADPGLRTGARGAAINTAAWIHLQEQNLAVSTFYRGNDTSPAVPAFYGLFFADGRPKPVAGAFALWAQMSQYPQRLQTTVIGDDALRALCGRNQAGQTALLIANPTQSPRSWRVEGWTPAGGVIRLAEMNPSDGSIRRSTLNSLAAEIPGPSIQLVEVAPALRVFSAASFVEGEAAPASLLSAFGENLSGATAEIRDAGGRTHPAVVFYDSSIQLNLLVPPEVALGAATLTAHPASGGAAEAVLNLQAVSPGLFTANSDGRGVPAAHLLRVLRDGSQALENVFRLDPDTGRFLPAELVVGEPGEETYLILYGTGIRGRSDVGAISALAGDTPCEVVAALAHSIYPGLDQVNLKLPPTLRGRGEITLRLAVDGRAANPVTLAFR